MWDILLPTVQDCFEMAKRELITKDILRTEYEGPRSKIAVFEVPFILSEDHLASFVFISAKY